MRALSVALAVLFLAGCGGGSGSGGGGAPEGPPVVSRAEVVKAPGVERATPKLGRDALGRRAADDARFGFELQPKLGEPGQSLAWSPYSVTHAFALAYAGARGETRAQLAEAFGFPADGDGPHAALNALDRAVESRAGKGVTIATANSAWSVAGYPWEREFLTVLARHHGAGLRTVDFAGDPGGVAKAIDAWVREQTRDKVKELFSPGDFDELTRLVLANAAYLKAEWDIPFAPESTRDRPFQAPDGTVDVPTMHEDMDVPAAVGDGWEAAELPYEGGQLAMLVILPDRGALQAVEEQLAGGLLADVTAALKPEFVAVALPRFRVESKLDLVPPLRELGVVDAFDESGKADLTGMTAAEELFVAKARQKAFIAVDEQGTEAAAATGLVVEALSARPAARPFVVDRPFLFVIRDRPTGAVLFSGRVMRPEE